MNLETFVKNGMAAQAAADQVVDQWKTKKLWSDALRGALRSTNADAKEIHTALKAIEVGSPIVKTRVLRALTRASAHGGLESLSEPDQALVVRVIGDLA